MLKSIKIIDFTQYLPGPFATQRLADMGAEVIKIESVDGGDPARQMAKGLVFQANNRKKKSISVNLKDEKDRNRILELIKNADVVIESFRPGVMKRLELSYEDLKKVKPDIVYCSLTGYGQEGALSHLGSHDLNYMAISGVLSQLKDSKGVPTHPSITLADLIGGIAASEKILAALLKKKEEGLGSYIDLSITEEMKCLLSTHLLFQQTMNKGNGIPYLEGSILAYSLYETSDGRFVSLAALEPKFWINFCHAIEKPKWVNQQFSRTILENPVYLELRELFTSKTLSQWGEFGERVDCCLAPVLEVHELNKHPLFKQEIETGLEEDSTVNRLPSLGEHNFLL